MRLVIKRREAILTIDNFRDIFLQKFGNNGKNWIAKKSCLVLLLPRKHCTLYFSQLNPLISNQSCVASSCSLCVHRVSLWKEYYKEYKAGEILRNENNVIHIGAGSCVERASRKPADLYMLCGGCGWAFLSPASLAHMSKCMCSKLFIRECRTKPDFVCSRQ
jgi:hypothetical protein